MKTQVKKLIVVISILVCVFILVMIFHERKTTPLYYNSSRTIGLYLDETSYSFSGDENTIRSLIGEIPLSGGVIRLNDTLIALHTENGPMVQLDADRLELSKNGYADYAEELFLEQNVEGHKSII